MVFRLGITRACPHIAVPLYLALTGGVASYRLRSDSYVVMCDEGHGSQRILSPESRYRSKSDRESSTSRSLRHWGERIGIFLNTNISIKGSDPRMRGIFSERRIKAGTKLVSIPRTSIICADNIEEDPGIGHMVGPLRSCGLDDRGVIVFWLVYHSLCPQSTWSEYLMALPDIYEMSKNHLLMTPETVASCLGKSVENMRANIGRQFRSFNRAMRKLDPPSGLTSIPIDDLEVTWRWAHAVTLSRSGISNSDEATKDWTQYPVSILPIIDFCNHADEPNATIREGTDGSMDLVAARDIQPGEEITITYWTKGRPLNIEQSLFSFGFPSSLSRFLLPGVDFSDADRSSRAAVQRLVFLEDRDEGKDDEIYLDSIDAAVDFFTIASLSDRQLDELKTCIMEEQHVGPRSRGILGEAKSSGQLRLIAMLEEWRNQIRSNRPKHYLLLSYTESLLSSIDDTIAKLSS